VDVKAAAKLVEEKTVKVLDVRTLEEFKEGHIAGAINADFLGDHFAKQLATVDKTQPVLVHCGGGTRSNNSLPDLKKLGFTTIFHLDGGLKAWQASGQPVSK
jgi:phage shock protein E